LRSLREISKADLFHALFDSLICKSNSPICVAFLYTVFSDLQGAALN
jgi:hypothetical protein